MRDGRVKQPDFPSRLVAASIGEIFVIGIVLYPAAEVRVDQAKQSPRAIELHGGAVFPGKGRESQHPSGPVTGIGAHQVGRLGDQPLLAQRDVVHQRLESQDRDLKCRAKPLETRLVTVRKRLLQPPIIQLFKGMPHVNGLFKGIACLHRVMEQGDIRPGRFTDNAEQFNILVH